jgi:hypothetical protein
MLGGDEHVALAAAVPDDAQNHAGSAIRTAALGVVTIAAVIRRLRHR